MRPTKEALIKKVCKDMPLLEYHIVDVLSDETLLQQIADNPETVIFGIVTTNQVDNKLFLTSHQFTNVVGTDIYIYIGNTQGQTAYQLLLADMSQIRRLDERLLTFMRNECNVCLNELDVKETLPDAIPDKIAATVQEMPNCLIYALITETMINKGIADILIAEQFEEIGDSHLFVYTGNTTGTNMANRLAQAALNTTIE
ncbi:MAG: hypothetical protein Q4C56_05305 [Peptococcaceae bacterium]|nr:hypothetical protein [Peptococcaceae bacterium]